MLVNLRVFLIFKIQLKAKNNMEERTASAREMIHRFKTSPPTSRSRRESERRLSNGPSRMWYEGNDTKKKNWHNTETRMPRKI